MQDLLCGGGEDREVRRVGLDRGEICVPGLPPTVVCDVESTRSRGFDRSHAARSLGSPTALFDLGSTTWAGRSKRRACTPLLPSGRKLGSSTSDWNGNASFGAVNRKAGWNALVRYVPDRPMLNGMTSDPVGSGDAASDGEGGTDGDACPVGLADEVWPAVVGAAEVGGAEDAPPDGPEPPHATPPTSPMIPNTIRALRHPLPLMFSSPTWFRGMNAGRRRIVKIHVWCQMRIHAGAT